MSTFETGYTGKIIESESVGKNRDLIEHEKKIDYLPFEQAMANVRKFQTETNHPYNPCRPSANRYPLAFGWHEKVAKELGLTDEELKTGRLKFFTAVDSILDRKHGIDSFLELELEDGQTIQVTLDVTINPHKISYKADEMIEIPADGFDYEDPEDQNKMAELIELHGEQIAKIFQNKLNQLQTRKSREVAYG